MPDLKIPITTAPDHCRKNCQDRWEFRTTHPGTQLSLAGVAFNEGASLCVDLSPIGSGREFDAGLDLIRDSVGAPFFTLAIAKINTQKNIMPKWHHYEYTKVRRSADRLPNKEHTMREEVLKGQDIWLLS